MTSSHTKEETRRSIAVQRQDNRESLIFAKRNLLSPYDHGSIIPIISEKEFETRLQTFRKPNNAQCFEALKKLNSQFFDSETVSAQNRWINEFFVDGDRTVHNLVGVFTNNNLDDSRIQAEAGVCLSNLCCTMDPKQKLVLARLASPYFVSLLADGVETTRTSLALVSLRGLGNLASDSKENKKLSRYFLSQNALEVIGGVIGHKNYQVRETACFALESVIQFQISNSKDSLSTSIKNLLRSQSGFLSNILDIFSEFEKGVTTPDLSIYGHCARILFLLSGSDDIDFPTPTSGQLGIILATVEKAWENSNLSLVFPLWRMIGMGLSRKNLTSDGELTLGNLSITLNLAMVFLQSPYVPLRKETLWVLSSIFADRNCTMLIGRSETTNRFLQPLIFAVVEIGSLTLCKETSQLCLLVLYNLVCTLGDILSQSETLKWSVLENVKRYFGALPHIGLKTCDDDVKDMIGALSRLCNRTA